MTRMKPIVRLAMVLSLAAALGGCEKQGNDSNKSGEKKGPAPKVHNPTPPTPEEQKPPPVATDTPATPAPVAPAVSDPTAPPNDVAAPPKDATKTESGLSYKVLHAGSGVKPDPTDQVLVHYTGWQTSGKMFDSSIVRGEPIAFPLNGVIAGWTEGVALMQIGAKHRLWIPEGLAYKGADGPPKGMLVFDVELLGIAPKAPADVAAPPADAEKTESGLASKVLRAGSGGSKPGPTDRVKVHYSGWTTDGQMFDSSVKRGETITFGLNQVIAGWTEGLGLMTEGEVRRLWIPENLAYKGQPGKPAGMLVFDVMLVGTNP